MVSLMIEYLKFLVNFSRERAFVTVKPVVRKPKRKSECSRPFHRIRCAFQCARMARAYVSTFRRNHLSPQRKRASCNFEVVPVERLRSRQWSAP